MLRSFARLRSTCMRRHELSFLLIMTMSQIFVHKRKTGGGGGDAGGGGAGAGQDYERGARDLTGNFDGVCRESAGDTVLYCHNTW